MRDLEELLDELDHNRSLSDPNRLRERLHTMDRLDAFRLDGEVPEESELSSGDDSRLRARSLYSQFEAANCALYEGIRREVQKGEGRESLLPWAPDGTVGGGCAAGLEKGLCFDYLDELISGVLQFPAPEMGSVRLDPEMVFYQPTPARHIFDLVGRTGLTEMDGLVDLGAGLGHVPLVVSICTGARCIGIELQKAYIDCARHAAQQLKLDNVTFLQQDVRAADLSFGTVFYLYTPFTGSILHLVLDRLRRESTKRGIRICALGPCTTNIAKEPWLQALDESEEDRIAVFRSRD
jgi:hypothetical protein